MIYIVKKCIEDEIVRILTKFDPYSDRPYSFRDDDKKRTWPKKLAAFANSILCYDDSGEIVGCLFFYDNELAKKNGEGYCVFFCVLPRFRRCGIASEMISRVKNHLNSKGIPFFKLRCAKSNEPAYKLYLKTGFDVSDEDEQALTMVSKT